MGEFEACNRSGVYTIYETDMWDPFGDDRLRLYWDHPRFPGEWSLRFSSFPIAPDDEPQDSCLNNAAHPWPREALARHFGFDGSLAACLPAELLFRMSPALLAGGRPPGAARRRSKRRAGGRRPARAPV
ncbi:MAG: hypothetical protein RMI94_10050 [Bryobacterales bacterium]|nr:hypothetical protein [Bryobacteraceae bacterium]MDW8130879.1 hypothetical protein [Bryobacterales bacterium]